MSTEYTDTIKSDTPLETFVWSCARAFGALITMGDDSHDAPIPQRFEPSKYSKNRLERTKARIAKVEAWSDADALADFTETQKSLDAYAKREETYKNYSRMLKLVKQWQTPTPDHDELKKFMIEQIEQSVEFDCPGYRPQQQQPTITATEWKREQLVKARHEAVIADIEWRNEQQRTNERNMWIDALRQSLTRKK